LHELGQLVAASPVPRSRNVAADQASYVKLVPGDTLDGRFLLGESNQPRRHGRGFQS